MPVFYCDALTYLSAKRHIVEQTSDLLGGRSHLRLITVGVHLEQLMHAFSCKCEQQLFDTEQLQPHAPSAVIAFWQCGQISVAQFKGSDRWTPQNWEEFKMRVLGRSAWGARLQSPWMMSIYYFSQPWARTEDARPLALMVASTQANTGQTLLQKADALNENIAVLPWDGAPPAVELRKMMLELNSAMRTDRAVAVGRRQGAEECRRQRDTDALAASQQCIVRINEVERRIKRRLGQQDAKDRVITTEEMDELYARGISVGQSSGGVVQSDVHVDAAFARGIANGQSSTASDLNAAFARGVASVTCSGDIEKAYARGASDERKKCKAELDLAFARGVSNGQSAEL